MKILLYIINALIWYLFFYAFLYSMKKDIHIMSAALGLSILIFLAFITCPIIINIAEVFMDYAKIKNFILPS